MISFVIPTYNRSHSIKKSIDSILNQSFNDWEIIIMDDGSTDNSKEVLKPYLQYPKIKYFNQINQGVAVARNNGFKKATGDFIVFLDSDDKVEENLVETLNEYSYKLYDLIFWDIRKIVDGQIIIEKPKNLGVLYNNVKGQFLAGSVCYSRNLLEMAGGYDPKMTFGENYELGIRVCKNPNLKSLYIEKTLATYYINNIIRTSNSVSNKLPSLVHQYKKHKKLFDSNRIEKFKVHNMLGFLLECANKRKTARKFYFSAWCIIPWKIKPLLRFIVPQKYL
jgi:glycosyltransferase involved in cell wall biosynthesis